MERFDGVVCFDAVPSGELAEARGLGGFFRREATALVCGVNDLVMQIDGEDIIGHGRARRRAWC